MKFVAISDTHCRHRNLKLPSGDVLLHAGDICYRGDKREVIDFLDWFGQQPFQYKIFIAGNHDLFFEKQTQAIIQALLPPSVIYLKDEEYTIDGKRIWGSPYTPFYYGWAFTKQRGRKIASHWDKIPCGIDVLLTHGPVYGILDVVINEQNAGDAALLKKVIEVKPRVHVCGHIHESYGQQKRHGIEFINASVLNESYELANRPVSFKI